MNHTVFSSCLHPASLFPLLSAGNPFLLNFHSNAWAFIEYSGSSALAWTVFTATFTVFCIALPINQPCNKAKLVWFGFFKEEVTARLNLTVIRTKVASRQVQIYLGQGSTSFFTLPFFFKRGKNVKERKSINVEQM